MVNNQSLTDIKSMTLPELTAFMLSIGEKAFRAKQLYQWIHVKLAASFDEMTNLSGDLRQTLKETCFLTVLVPEEENISKLDGTRKYLFALADNNMIESVWMEYQHGNSVCISTQVGCRMGCRFCASTIGGVVRNLTAAEMLDQVYRMQQITGKRVSNVVLMGSGEPLDNYDNVVRFLELITDENGLNLSGRNITLSTCGIVERIYDLAKLKFPITLALSLHASNQETRKKLMPIAYKYPLEQVLKACDDYYEATGRRLSYEFSLVAGVNDSSETAKELANLLRGRHCHVNLIPVNPVKERDFVGTTHSNAVSFQKMLEKYGINATIRREMGRDINGACGQLRRSYLEKKQVPIQEGDPQH